MGKLIANVRNRRDLSAADVTRMYDLFAGYYDGAKRDGFERDLAVKSHVIELLDQGELRGFSTVCVFTVGAGVDRVNAIFSGDTIIHQDFWGEQALALAFCRLAGMVKADAPEVPLYWFLISKGYRTYRYLSLFSLRYFPHATHPTPPHLQALLDELARTRFGTCYDPATGLIRLLGTRLRADYGEVRDGLRQRPEVAYFLARNPRHADGDELACMCELHEDNLKSIALRAFRDGLQSASAGALCVA